MYLGARHSVADPGRRGKGPGSAMHPSDKKRYGILMTECTDPILAALFTLITNEKKVSSGIPIFGTTWGKANTRCKVSAGLKNLG